MRGQSLHFNIVALSLLHLLTPGADRADASRKAWLQVRGGEARIETPHARSVAFSADGRRLVVAGGQTAQVIDVATLDVLGERADHGVAIIAAALTADGGQLVTAGGTDVKVWPVGAPKPRLTLAHEGNVTAAVLDPRGDRLATADDGARALRLWDLAAGREMRTLRSGDGGVIRYVTFAPAALGDALLTAETNPEIRQRTLMSLWDVENGTTRWTYMGGVNHNVWRSPATFSADGRFVAIVEIFWLQVLNTNLRTYVAQYEHYPHVVRFAPTGHRLLQLGRNVAVIEVAPRAPEEQWRALEGLDHARYAEFSPDGRWVLAASRTANGIWDAATGRRVIRLPDDQAVADLAFSPGGDTVAVVYAGEHDDAAVTSVWRLQSATAD